MLDGTSIKQKFYLVKNSPMSIPTVLPVLTPKQLECCGDFTFKVLASSLEGDATDTLKNDVSGPLWWFNSTTTDAVLSLLKYNLVTGIWDVLADMTHSTAYGSAYDYGFFTNDAEEKFVGYQLEWRKVLVLHGAGSYKVRCESTSFFGNTVTDTFEYCLKQYTALLAENTVRVEYNLNAIIGDNANDLKRRDYGSINWYNSMRLPGYFSYFGSEYDTERTKYNSGERVRIKDGQEAEYILSLDPVFWAVHDIFRTDIMQSEQVTITDYNSRNIGEFINRAMIKKSGYFPGFQYLDTRLAPVEVRFIQTNNNYDRLRCG